MRPPLLTTLSILLTLLPAAAAAANDTAHVRATIQADSLQNGSEIRNGKVTITQTLPSGKVTAHDIPIPNGAVFTQRPLLQSRAGASAAANGELVIEADVAVPASAEPQPAPRRLLAGGQCDMTGLNNWHDAPAVSTQAAQMRDSHRPDTIAAYMRAQNLDDRAGYTQALAAFSGVTAADMPGFITTPANASLLRTLADATLANQKWYEPLTSRLRLKVGALVDVQWPAPPVVFSAEQLRAMRAAYEARDGMLIGGNLMLAYPDRLERNERRITQTYSTLSNELANLIGAHATWPTMAVWASDTVGRSLAGDFLIRSAETLGSNPRYWLSAGNTRVQADTLAVFKSLVDTYRNGANRNITFDTFWERLVERYRGQGVVYIDGDALSIKQARTATRAYYEAMIWNDLEKAIPWPAVAQATQARKRQLVLYGSLQYLLIEQRQLQRALDNSMCVLGIVNPLGAGTVGINLHLPSEDGKRDRVISTAFPVADTPFRVHLDHPFFSDDRRWISLRDDVRNTLNGLPKLLPVDKYERANSGTLGWNLYGERMAYVFHLFASVQQDPSMFTDVRGLYGYRSQDTNATPVIEYALLPY